MNLFLKVEYFWRGFRSGTDYVIRIPSLNDRREELPFILDTMLQMPAFNPGKTIRVREVGADESCIAKLNRLPSIVFSSIK